MRESRRKSVTFIGVKIYEMSDSEKFFFIITKKLLGITERFLYMEDIFNASAGVSPEAGGDEFRIRCDMSAPRPQAFTQDWPQAFTVEGMMMILCHCGRAELSIDGMPVTLEKDSLLILSEKRFVQRTALTGDLRISMLAFTNSFILEMPSPIDTNIFIYPRLTPLLSCSGEKLRDFESYFRFIEKESRESGRYRTSIIRALIFALLLEVTAEYEDRYRLDGADRIRNESIPDRFFRLLAANFRIRRTVCWYASQLNLTPKYLSQLIKECSGRTILDWIHESVMLEARMLLKTSEMTIQQISDQLNFSSPSAFVQFFRKHSGHTPGAERVR